MDLKHFQKVAMEFLKKNYLVMVQYIVYRDYCDKPFRDNYIVTKAIS